VPINKSDEWWRGTDFTDLTEYVRAVTASGYPANRVAQSVCACGGTYFRLAADATEGCARSTCNACGSRGCIGDSAEYWEDAAPESVACPCGSDQFEIGVGFALRDNGDVRWITIGTRCVTCSVLGSPVDWKIDYSPTGHLLRAV
jgi:hypothetical protein